MRLIFIILLPFFTSCAYNNIKITTGDNSSITCPSTVNKPVDVQALTEPLKGSTNTVPLSGI